MDFIQCGRFAASLGAVWTLSISVVVAAPINAASPTTRIEQEREQAQRLEQLEQAKESVQQLQPLPVLPDSSGDVPDMCFDVDVIEFQGNHIFSDAELLALIQFTPACVGVAEINEYLRVITNHYIESGYVTSRAFMTPQDLSSGTLKIVVLEGKVEKVLWNGEVHPWLNMAFPAIADSVLNLREIEQGLDQINRLSRYNATIKLLPSSKPGYSLIDLQTSVGKLGSLGLGLNNSGQKSTGEEQIALNVTGENVLQLLDQWTMSATKSAAFVDSKASDSLYLAVDVPVGFWNVGYRTSYSTYKTTFENQGFIFVSTGKTNSHYLDAKWLFYRDSSSKSALKATLSHRREKNYILGNLLDASSRNLSSLTFSWEHSTRLANGFFTLLPSFSFGADWFGGEENQSNDPRLAKAEFNKGTLTGSYTYPITPQLTWTSTLFGQWSNDTLYGSERISIGGEYSVRGFKGASLSGDEGYYWRNDLTYNIGQWPLLGSAYAQLALDTGSIAKDVADQYERGSLMGSSLSIKTSQNYMSTALGLGVPIAAPSRLQNDDYVVYYRIDIKL
ncbi:hemolysin activator protein [Vibrio galatheae]|uniref:Hemolysin activator protein n=1 Tax=Vibrio galatheae TaxID=579748 RepID=A0A0F4NED9_9VIBR|nr:ShlB/FhaC/HecB family hemolysin secretion/activation protein [Vibrio galatheae]KJY81445.1 hemolysin activator protein [Vibrio galatheae]